MAASPGSAAASEGGPYAPPQTCEAFETAEGAMALRLGLNIKTWTLNQDIGSTGKNTRAWCFEGMEPIPKQLLLDICKFDNPVGVRDLSDP